MRKNSLNGLVIRGAALRTANAAYLYTADPEKEANEIPHAVSIKYVDGSITKFDVNFDAHALTFISKPEPGIIVISGAGYYSSVLMSGTRSANIFDESSPKPPTPRMSGLRSISTIAGQAYAVGLRGMVYRFEKIKKWERLDDGLPETFDIQAIHGLSDKDIYAVGRNGQIYHFNGNEWTICPVVTSHNLTSIFVAADGTAYVVGHGGVILKGRSDQWQLIDSGEITENFWSVHEFKGDIYVSSMQNLFKLQDGLIPVDFGGDNPSSCYQLTSCDEVLWSVGEFDVMSFDGKEWKRII